MLQKHWYLQTRKLVCGVTPTCKLSRMMRSDWTCLLTALEKRSYVAASYSLISISFNLRQKVRQKQRCMPLAMTKPLLSKLTPCASWGSEIQKEYKQSPFFISPGHLRTNWQRVSVSKYEPMCSPEHTCGHQDTGAPFSPSHAYQCNASVQVL